LPRRGAGGAGKGAGSWGLVAGGGGDGERGRNGTDDVEGRVLVGCRVG